MVWQRAVCHSCGLTAMYEGIGREALRRKAQCTSMTHVVVKKVVRPGAVLLAFPSPLAFPCAHHTPRDALLAVCRVTVVSLAFTGRHCSHSPLSALSSPPLRVVVFTSGAIGWEVSAWVLVPHLVGAPWFINRSGQDTPEAYWALCRLTAMAFGFNTPCSV